MNCTRQDFFETIKSQALILANEMLEHEGDEQKPKSIRRLERSSNLLTTLSALDNDEDWEDIDKGDFWKIVIGETYKNLPK